MKHRRCRPQKKEKGRNEFHLESTVDEWVEGARKRMTRDDLAKAARALRKGQQEIPGYRSLPRAHAEEPFVPEDERLRRLHRP